MTAENKMFSDLSKEITKKVIQSRRTTYANQFTGEDIPKETIREVLESAIWAPTHKMTQPWKFFILRGKHIKKFGNFMAEFYKSKSAGDFHPDKEQRIRQYPLKSGCIVVIVMQRSKDKELPEWEELASVSCAVQNIALTCTSRNIAGYWDTCEAGFEYAKVLGLKENEKCLGVFYMGYCATNNISLVKKRISIDKKISWIE